LDLSRCETVEFLYPDWYDTRARAPGEGAFNREGIENNISCHSRIMERKMNKFDTVIWRINGIIILSVGIVVGGISLFAAYKIYRETTRERNVIEVVNLNAETKKEEKLYLRYFDQVEGRPYLVGSLYSDQKYELSSYSESSSSLRNLLYLDEKDRSSHWRLDSHDWLILNEHEMFDSLSSEEKDRKIEGFVYEVVNKDSNQDGFLDDEDKILLLLADFKGENVKTVEEDIDDVLFIKQKDLQSFVAIINKDGKTVIKEIDFKTGKENNSSDLIPIELR
jgi:hypothetical protein